MTFADLKNKIKENVQLAQDSKVQFETIYENKEVGSGENEFIFFIKPELTLKSAEINFSAILDLAFSKIQEFNLEIKDVKILSADYLREYNIIAQHYGVINKLAAAPIDNMSEGAKAKLCEFAGVSNLQEANVMGAFQFLEKYPMFNAESLDILWQNKSLQKLAGGTYCQNVKVDTDNIYLINGFHPRQITHFTHEGRSIVVFTVSGNVSWADARGKFIGATNPSSAESGSLRNDLLNGQKDYGVPEVSQGLNGFHLSAGPVEGLVELIRYNSNFTDPAGIKNYADFSFGKKLAESFSNEEINQMLQNKNVEFSGKTISVFDLTEEKSAGEALEILKQAFGK